MKRKEKRLVARSGKKEIDGKEQVILEQDRRLSESLLWQMQRDYYQEQGLEAWRQGMVPQYITSSPFTARAYTRLVYGYLRDCHTRGAAAAEWPSLDPDQPLYIVDLGAGSGRFAYHFLKAFNARPAPCASPICYVMTDLAAQTIDAWRSHPAWQPAIVAGQLDFAPYDAVQPGDLHLLHSGRCLSPGRVANPLIAIANYFFDSIPQDAFTIQEGRLYENRVTLALPTAAVGLSAAEQLRQVEISFARHPVPAAPYSDPDWNRILQDYAEHLDETTISFPSAALRCIAHLEELSGGRLLLLAGDKGYADQEALRGLPAPWLNLHGSFSIMVNYHALTEYVHLRGGQTLQPPHHHADLHVAAFMLGRHPGEYAETRLAFQEAIVETGPDDFYALKKSIEGHYAECSLAQLLAWLRCSGWDAEIFLDMVPALLNLVRDAPAAQCWELRRAAAQIWDMYYALGEKRDLGFHMGTVLQAAALYLPALDAYQRSLDRYGPNLSTHYNMGTCHYHLQQWDAAQFCMDQVLEIDPEFEAARVMKEKILVRRRA